MLRLGSIPILFIVFLSLTKAGAQPYYQLTTTNGTQTVGNVNIGVTPAGSTLVYNVCGYGPYCTFVGSYKYVFSIPVNAIRIFFQDINSGTNGGDTLSIRFNGSHYNITSANLSACSSSCNGPTNSVIIIGGNLTGTVTTTNTIQFDAQPGYGLDTVVVDETAAGGSGILWSFYFYYPCKGRLGISHDTACTGSSLHLVQNDTAISSNATYSWTGPNGFSSTQKNPVINNLSSAAQGAYFVTVTDTCVFTDSVYITVHQAPVISVFASNPICTSDSLSFILNTNMPASYTWTGPGTFSSYLQNPKKLNIQLTDSGNYTVIATANACSDTLTTHISVFQKPAKPSCSSNGPVCSGSTINLTANCTTPGVAYSWTGPNNFTSSAQNPVINSAPLADSGYYIVSATLSNVCHAFDTIFVAVRPIPIVNILSNNPTCIGGILLMSGSGTSGVNYSWSGPNGFNFPSSSNVSVSNLSAANAGPYYVTASLNGCVLHDTLNIVVNPSPAKPVASNNGPLCSGSTLHLTASSSTPGVSYSWSGPNSYVAGNQNAVVNNISQADTGSYVVTTFLANCSASDTTSVNIIQGPDSVYINSNSPLCSGDTLHIHSGSSTSGVNYGWTGPNSFSSSIANPFISNAHVNNSGNYYLTASLNGCMVLDTMNIVVNTKPATPTVSTNSPVCTGDTLKFTGTCTTMGVTYLWLGPNSYNTSTQNPQIPNASANNAGTYTLTVFLGSCSSSTASFVTIKPLPANVSINSNSPVCANDSLHVNSTSTTAGVSYSWNGPNSFYSSSQNFTIYNTTNSNAGNYYLAVSLNGCSVYDTLNAVVKPLPSVPAISTNSPVCVGKDLTFSVSSTSGSYFSWTGPNNFMSFVYDPVVSNAQLYNWGYYFAIASLNGCASKDSVLVSVNPNPALPTANCNNPVCANDTLFLHANSTSPGVAYNWIGPNGFISNQSSPFLPYVSLGVSGNYYAIFSLNGCKDTVTVPVTVNPVVGPPLIAVSVSPGDTVCIGTNLTFTATSSNASGPIYQWRKDGISIPGATSPAFTTGSLSNGDHISCYVSSNIVCQLTDTAISNVIHLDLIAIAPPQVSVSHYPASYVFGNLVTFTGHVVNNIPGLTFKWTKNGAFIPGAIYSTYSASDIGESDIICFIAYSSQPCTTPDSSIACSGTTGISNLYSSAKSIMVYPNPITNQLIVEGAENGTFIKIYNVMGQLVYTGVINTSSPTNGFVINTSSFISGTYLLEITGNDGFRETRKIVK